MKPMSELSPSRQKARLTIFKKRRQKFNLVNGLFNVDVVKDMGTSTVIDKDGVAHPVHKFFYAGAPAGAKNVEEEGITGFVPFNETIFTENKNAQKAVDKRLAMIDLLKQKRKNNKKTVRASIDYKIVNLNGKTYRNIDGLRLREPKTDK